MTDSDPGNLGHALYGTTVRAERLEAALRDAIRTYCEDVCPDPEQMDGYVNSWLLPLGLRFDTHQQASAYFRSRDTE